MCPKCGFDYAVRPIETPVGSVYGYTWTCGCGTKYLPPGGLYADLVSP